MGRLIVPRRQILKAATAALIGAPHIARALPFGHGGGTVAGGGADAFVSLINGMTAGTWASVANTLNAALYNGSFVGSLGSKAATTYAWSGGCYDSDHKQFVVWGGGHQDGYSNGVYGFSLPTLTWSMLRTPSNPTGWNGTDFTFPSDGLLISSHNYDSVAYAPGFGMYTNGGINQSGNITTNFWVFNTASNTWVQKTGNAVLGQYTGISVVDSSGNLYYSGSTNATGALSKYVPSTDTWSAIGSNGVNTAGQNSTMAYDGTSGVAVAVGAANNYGAKFIKLVNLSTGAVTDVTSGCTGDTTPLNISAPGMVYDPNIGKYVLWGGATASTGTANVWIYDATANTMTLHAPNGANTVTPTSPVKNPGIGQTDGTYGRWQLVAYGGVRGYVLQNDILDNIYIYKPDF